MRIRWSLVGLGLMACTILGLALILALSRSAQAHCDTLSGPVVKDARRALAKRDVSPALKWIKPKHETEVRSAFSMALSGRPKEAKGDTKSDLRFFETLVRLHRAGEGEPFTGLKPADQVEPIIAASDRALEQGSCDKLVKTVTDDVSAGIRKRFALAAERRQRADKSVAEGRKYVEAYVDYVHYVERLHDSGEATGGHRGDEKRHGVVANGGG